jgi:hypothetical protein
VKTPKPKQPPELLAAATLVAREVLVQFGARAAAACAAACVRQC